MGSLNCLRLKLSQASRYGFWMIFQGGIWVHMLVHPHHTCHRTPLCHVTESSLLASSGDKRDVSSGAALTTKQPCNRISKTLLWILHVAKCHLHCSFLKYALFKKSFLDYFTTNKFNQCLYPTIIVVISETLSSLLDQIFPLFLTLTLTLQWGNSPLSH